MSWRKLNHLVPEPQCRTDEGIITEWKDSRPQPSQAEIDAVSEADVLASESLAAAAASITPEIELMIEFLFNNVPALSASFTDMTELKAGMAQYIEANRKRK